MAQYYEFTDPETNLKVRIGARVVAGPNPAYVEDREINVSGFSGTENVDWENITLSE